MPDDLKAHVSKAGYQDLAALVRSDMSVQALVGADASTLLRLPSQTRAENPGAWADVNKALGVPADGKYAEFTPANGKLAVGEAELATFDSALAQAGATPDVRNASLQVFHDLNQKAMADQAQAMALERQEHQQALSAEWGMMAPVKLGMTEQALDGMKWGSSLMALLDRHGYKDHPIVLGALAEIAEMRGEAGAPPGGGQEGGPQGAMTPDQAQQAIAAKQGDAAFMLRYNTGDQAAIDEMKALYMAAHPAMSA